VERVEAGAADPGFQARPNPFWRYPNTSDQ